MMMACDTIHSPPLSDDERPSGPAKAKKPKPHCSTSTSTYLWSLRARLRGRASMKLTGTWCKTNTAKRGIESSGHIHIQQHNLSIFNSSHPSSPNCTQHNQRSSSSSPANNFPPPTPATTVTCPTSRPRPFGQSRGSVPPPFAPLRLKINYPPLRGLLLRLALSPASLDGPAVCSHGEPLSRLGAARHVCRAQGVMAVHDHAVLLHAGSNIILLRQHRLARQNRPFKR